MFQEKLLLRQETAARAAARRAAHTGAAVLLRRYFVTLRPNVNILCQRVLCAPQLELCVLSEIVWLPGWIAGCPLFISPAHRVVGLRTRKETDTDLARTGSYSQ